MIAILILPVYIIGNYYVCRWFMKWLDTICKGHLKIWVRVLVDIVYWTLCMGMYIAALVPEGSLRRVLNVAGTYWYGVVIYILLIVGILDLIRIIIRKVKKIPKSETTITRKKFIALGTVVVVIIGSIAVFGGIQARTINTAEYEIDVNKDGGNIDSLNVVLVADQHMGYSVGTSMMQDMVNKINAYNPDIVIMAGDIFDNNYDALDDPERLIDIYRQIHSKYGVYAVYGNHDIDEMIIAGFTFPTEEKLVADTRMDEFLEKAGVVNLRDEYVLIDDSFYLYGRPDYSKEGRGIDGRKTPAALTANLDKSKPVFVIDHEPRELQELSDAGVDVDMSGHTHDGQIFPLNFTSKLIWENSRGLLKKGDMISVVTSGVGFYGPGIRVGTEAEVVDLKVNFK